MAGGLATPAFCRAYYDRDGICPSWKTKSGCIKEKSGSASPDDLCAFCGISLCQFTYFMAIEASNAGTATVLQYLSPILILSAVCIKEKRRPVGLELGAIGLSLLENLCPWDSWQYKVLKR